jgi:hypothetical protein
MGLPGSSATSPTPVSYSFATITNGAAACRLTPEDRSEAPPGVTTHSRA